MSTWKEETFVYVGRQMTRLTIDLPMWGLAVVERHSGEGERWKLSRGFGTFRHVQLDAETADEAKLEALQVIHERLGQAAGEVAEMLLPPEPESQAAPEEINA